LQYQQQHHLAFGQTPKPSVEGNQTFSSAFDTFVSSEPGETFLLYVEPVGYKYDTVTDSDGNRLYTMNFTLDFLISNKDGNVLGRQQDIPIK
jgi:hypothetical protein